MGKLTSQTSGKGESEIGCTYRTMDASLLYVLPPILRSFGAIIRLNVVLSHS